MLIMRSITLKNLATICDTTLEFEKGFNVLTGETGSGKSILVDGLMLAAGARADKSLVRPGTGSASVEAVFINSDGEETLVRREISAQGRSRVFMDDALSTLEEVREAVQGFVELHSQRSTPILLKPSKQMDILDQFAGVFQFREKYAALFNKLKTSYARKEKIGSFLGISGANRELLQHEMSLFDRLNPDEADYEALLEERNRIRKVLEQSVLFQETMEALQGDDGVSSVISGVLRRIHREAPDRTELAELLSQASISVAEACNLVQAGISDLDDAPERLNQIDIRLDDYSRLISRSGGTIQSMLERRASLSEELDKYISAEEELKSIENALPAMAEEVIRTAGLLTSKRLAAGKILGERAVKEMKELNMPWVQFSLAFPPPASPVDIQGRTLDVRGAESVLFLFTANNGIPMESLDAVASGGELSRVALSLALVMADTGSASTLIFDEIDAGTGGETAHRLADSLVRASRSRQIIVISHLAQVASRADNHLAVVKDYMNGMPVTTVSALKTRAQRLTELTRLLGGGTGASEHADSLLGGSG